MPFSAPKFLPTLRRHPNDVKSRIHRRPRDQPVYAQLGRTRAPRRVRDHENCGARMRQPDPFERPEDHPHRADEDRGAQGVHRRGDWSGGCRDEVGYQVRDLFFSCRPSKAFGSRAVSSVTPAVASSCSLSSPYHPFARRRASWDFLCCMREVC